MILKVSVVVTRRCLWLVHSGVLIYVELTCRVAATEGLLKDADTRALLKEQMASLKTTENALRDRLNISYTDMERKRLEIDNVKKSVNEVKEEKEMVMKTMKAELPATKCVQINPTCRVANVC